MCSTLVNNPNIDTPTTINKHSNYDVSLNPHKLTLMLTNSDKTKVTLVIKKCNEPVQPQRILPSVSKQQ